MGRLALKVTEKAEQSMGSRWLQYKGGDEGFERNWKGPASVYVEMVCEEACFVGDEKSEIETTPGVATWVGQSVDLLQIEMNLMAEAGWEDVGRLPSRVLLRNRLDVVQIDVGVVKVEAFPVLQATGSMVKVISSRRVDI